MKEIILSHGIKMMVDDEDYDHLIAFKWYPHRIMKSSIIYSYTNSKGSISTKPIYAHRKIMKITDSKLSVDHIDGNGLNNQKSNLRVCTHSQNLRNSRLSSKNTTGFKGVYYHKTAKKFMAYIRHNYKMYNLGLYKTAKEAALARNKKSEELHGKFGFINQV